MKTLSLGQASSKCAFPFFSYLIPNAFSLVDMNNNLPLRWGFMNQDEKKESPEFSFFFPFLIVLASLVFPTNQQLRGLSFKKNELPVLLRVTIYGTVHL